MNWAQVTIRKTQNGILVIVNTLRSAQVFIGGDEYVFTDIESTLAWLDTNLREPVDVLGVESDEVEVGL